MGDDLWLITLMLNDLYLWMLTCKVPNTTIAKFANTVDPDETAHNEPSHQDLQYLPSQHNAVINIESFPKFCRHNFVIALWVKCISVRASM